MGFLRIAIALLDKGGTSLAGAMIIASGVSELAPSLGVPEHLAHGIVWVCAGIAVLVIGRKAKKTTDLVVANAAEIRINNPNLPTSSNIPQIQSEIVKQVQGTSSNTGQHPTI